MRSTVPLPKQYSTLVAETLLSSCINLLEGVP